MGRRTCDGCGKGYNICNIQRDGYSMDPLLSKKEGVCDKCAGKLIIRSDDTKDVITARMKEYEAKTLPLLTIYQKRGNLINFEAKKGKKGLDEKTIVDRRKITKNLGKEIVELSNRNSRVPGQNGTAATDGDVERLDDGKRSSNKRREERRAKREKRKKGKKEDGELDELGDDGKEPVQMSAQEQAFMEARDVALAEQDLIIDEISKGLDELLELGEDMNKTIQMQNHMLAEVEKKVDSNLEKLRNVNQRLKTILDQTGGLERWCPMIVLAIVLLALGGYIFTITTGKGF